MQTQQQSLVGGKSGKTPGGVVNKSGERHWPKAENKESLDNGQRPWLEGRLGGQPPNRPYQASTDALESGTCPRPNGNNSPIEQWASDAILDQRCLVVEER